MNCISGEILTDVGFKSGYLAFEKEIIVETGKGNSPKKPICKGLIVPTFVNAHTHIGDSFVRERDIKLPKNVEELVAPPNGLKHKLLRETSDEDIIKGMEKSMDIMIKNGIEVFCDFRESGVLGISQLKASLQYKKISSIILGRPDSLEYDKDETDILLKNSDGIGLSSISDWNYSELQKIARQTKNKNKIFAIHASELIREDIDKILDLKPNFLVHMVKATEADLIRVKDENIPIVICPRSNAFFGLKANVSLMKQIGIDILLGTDNAMMNSPNILDEMIYLKNQFSEFSKEELLNMITYIPRKALNQDDYILGPNSPANFVVLDKKSLKPLYVSIDK